MRCSALWAFAVALGAFGGVVLAQNDAGVYDEASRVYRNTVYGFSCKVPAGWVLRTEQMNAGAGKDGSGVGSEDGSKDESKHATNDPSGGRVLLAALERPPEATGPEAAEAASAIVVAAEKQADYPGVKSAEDYFGPLAEVVAAKGFRATNDPYAFQPAAWRGDARVMREDFSREIKDRGTIYQSTLVMLSRGSIVSFTFLAASEDDVDGLVEGLVLARGGKGPPKAGAKKVAGR